MNQIKPGFAAWFRGAREGVFFRAPARPEGEDPFRGRSGQDLLRAYRKMDASKRKNIDYSTVRKLVFTLIDNVGGKVTCAYTGREYTRGDVPDDKDMNIEHVWPQSKGAKGTAKTDMHHLFSTDSEANSKRGSLPFGIVTQNEWEKGGSILGRDKDGAECFMPRKEVRGNVARAIFHFATVYGFRIDAKEEAILRQWAKDDPADEAELARMLRVMGEQGTANYYVQFPGILERVDTFDRVPGKTFSKLIGFR